LDVPSLAEVRRLTEKKRDAWWTVLLVDPVATPLVRWTAKWTRITPNQITWAALVLGLGSAACFATGAWTWLLVGAGLYHVSFVLDCMDGKLARLTGRGSVFGAWLDYVFDRVRVLACAVALMGGQYHRTGNESYLWLALAVTFLDMLRYVDALQIFKIRHGMRKQIKARARAARWQDHDERQLAFMEDLLRENPEADVDQPGPGAAVGGTLPVEAAADGETEDEPAPAHRREVVDLHQEFRHRFPWYTRLRTFLLRHRIRTHLMSGIEFQMAVFIIGPAVRQVAPVTIAAAALLFLFELAIIYKLLLSTRDFARTLAAFGPPVESAAAPALPHPEGDQVASA
jgi:phosphatidylglycerophosphate synthase